MRYQDIGPTISHRFRLSKSHPVLATITMNAVDFHRFDQLVDDHPETNLVGHDDPKDGMITAFVACASDEVAEALENSWA